MKGGIGFETEPIEETLRRRMARCLLAAPKRERKSEEYLSEKCGQARKRG